MSVAMARAGALVGTPENCVHMLENEECVAVSPEGTRGMNKPYSQRYRLQRMGLGFMRLALETRTPIVPVAIVGSDDQQEVCLLGKFLDRSLTVRCGVAQITLASRPEIRVSVRSRFEHALPLVETEGRLCEQSNSRLVRRFERAKTNSRVDEFCCVGSTVICKTPFRRTRGIEDEQRRPSCLQSFQHVLDQV